MTVTYRLVETSLQRLMRKPGGMKAPVAVDAAEQNLTTIEGECLAALDQELAAIAAVAAPGGERRLAAEELAAAIAAAERALTVSTGVSLPFLGETLRMLCALAEALMESEHWPEGALQPAVNVLVLVRARQLDAESGALVMRELERCLERYRQYGSRPAALDASPRAEA